MRLVYEEAISGHPVIDSSGRVIGEVVGQVVDSGSWQVEALRVKLHKEVTQELGVSRGAFRAARLDVPTQFVQDVSDTIVLKGPVGALRMSESAPAQTS